MFMYEIVECYSMSTSSIILMSEEEYSMEEFQNICNSIKNEEGYDKNYTQRHIIERLVKEYGFKEIEVKSRFSYDF